MSQKIVSVDSREHADDVVRILLLEFDGKFKVTDSAHYADWYDVVITSSVGTDLFRSMSMYVDGYLMGKQVGSKRGLSWLVGTYQL